LRSLPVASLIHLLCRKPFVVESKEERQRLLLKYHMFNCKCTACLEDYKTLAEYYKAMGTKRLPIDPDSERTISTVIKELEKYFIVFSDNAYRHPCFETVNAIYTVSQLLEEIGRGTRLSP